ncbi:MAG: hypothetical protein Rhob2KO_39010 [Rhodopirellula baltica]
MAATFKLASVKENATKLKSRTPRGGTIWAWEATDCSVGTNFAWRVERDRGNAKDFIKRMQKARKNGGIEAGEVSLRNENRNAFVSYRILTDSLAKLAVDSFLRLSPN